MSLRTLPLKVTYRSGDCDILNEFYIPCLQRSVLYKRAVGFFTSATLAEAARGLVDFVRNGGKMMIVACPRLTPEDVERISEGYEKRKVIEERLLSSLVEEIDETNILRAKNITWMIANGLLDIKIAVPTIEEAEGIYHEKVGIFYDSDNTEESSVVVFSGSLNETKQGLISNYESIDVFVSWDESDREKNRIAGHISHFDKMWRGNADGVETYDFPDAVAKRLIQRYSPEEPSVEPGRKRSPYKFQSDAINSWVTNSMHGILAMATGTGKTFTALKCVEQTPRQVLAVVAVPQDALVEQWIREIQSEYNGDCRIVQVHSQAEWKERLGHLLEGISLGVALDKRNFVVGTIQTMHKKDFRLLLKTFDPEKIMLIVDEVHHSGAQNYRNLFDLEAKYRLGLSATPERDWDDEGNQAIFEYFGPEVFVYDINQAIADGMLTPYDYHVAIVSLTEDEHQDFKLVSQKISQTLSRVIRTFPELRGASIPTLLQNLGGLDPSLGKSLRALFLQRVDIVKQARNKLVALRDIVTTNDLHRCLVYCNDLNHLTSCSRLLHEEGFVGEEYSSAISPDIRARLLASFASDFLETRFLLSIKCLDEGIDLPAVDSAILVASSRSTREFIQRRGRILRKHPTKKVSTIFDIVVLPVEQDKLGYALTDSERQFVVAEVNRVAHFALSASNANGQEIKQFLKKFSPFIAEKD